MKYLFWIAISIFSLLLFSKQTSETASDVSLLVLGITQDAGYPQINCYKPHCMSAWEDYSKRRLASSLAVIDKISKQKFLFEATPDIKLQLYRLYKVAPDPEYTLAGILLTHGHMGHYSGLMHFGREAAATRDLPVYVMPRMKKYLSQNGPWSQLVKLDNIVLREMKNNQPTLLNARISITPIAVPHRDEFTETVGFKIVGPNKTALFIPDIDKWQRWQLDIRKIISQVDYAFVDGTFFSANELSNRNMREIPHPLVTESMKLFKTLSVKDKQKIIFIHFNHSNPLLHDGTVAGRSAQQMVIKAGFRYAREGMKVDL